MRIYMDYAATTPVDPRVVESMSPYWTQAFGNPSSGHAWGQEARDGVERARDRVAERLNAHRDEVVFTSGGSESDNAAIQLTRHLKDRGNHLVCSAIEHDAVLKTLRHMEREGFRLTVLPVDSFGLVDPDDVRKALTSETLLVSVHHANNEIGTIEPIYEIGRICREWGVLFHTDAVQTFGHLPIDVQALPVDLLSLSGHKLYGPKGVGALYIRRGTAFAPLIHGGGQEDRRRASTHNVPGIVGLGMAAEIASVEIEQEMMRLPVLRQRLWDRLQAALEGVTLNGHPDHRLPNNLNLSIAGVEGQSLLMALDLEGLAASSGSACASGSGRGSHVLEALHPDGQSGQGSLRLTLGRLSTEAECDQAADIVITAVKRLRALSGF